MPGPAPFVGQQSAFSPLVLPSFSLSSRLPHKRIGLSLSLLNMKFIYNPNRRAKRLPFSAAKRAKGRARRPINLFIKLLERESLLTSSRVTEMNGQLGQRICLFCFLCYRRHSGARRLAPCRSHRVTHDATESPAIIAMIAARVGNGDCRLECKSILAGDQSIVGERKMNQARLRVLQALFAAVPVEPQKDQAARPVDNGIFAGHLLLFYK